MDGSTAGPAAAANSRQQCRVANVRDQVLTVHINNAAWATRLRFLIPDLLQSLNRLADFTAIDEVRLKTVPAVADVIVSVTARPEIHALPSGFRSLNSPTRLIMRT